MPMGIVSDKDFESELSNVVSITPKQHQEPCMNNSDSFIPTVIDSIPTDSNSDSSIIVDGQIQDIKTKGRSVGDVNVPETIRKLIGETAAIEGRASALELANKLGVSPSSVSAYAVGATSTKTYHDPQAELVEYISSRKKKLSKKALNRLNLAIHHITKEKLVDAKLTDIVSVANAMSQVVKNLNPEPKNAPIVNENKPVFILHAPQLKSEDKYEVIHSRE